MKDLVKFIVENADKFKYDEEGNITNLEIKSMYGNWEFFDAPDFARGDEFRFIQQPKKVNLGLTDNLVGQVVINPNYSKLQITEQHGDCVKIGDKFYTYGQLREIFTRLDGTKFEKEV